ncbi:MAG: peptide deformylase [Promethearchaeota archaeon]
MADTIHIDVENQHGFMRRQWNKFYYSFFAPLSEDVKHELSLNLLVLMCIVLAYAYQYTVLFAEHGYVELDEFFPEEVMPSIATTTNCVIPEWYDIDTIQSSPELVQHFSLMPSEEWCAPNSQRQKVEENRKLGRLIRHMKDILTDRPKDFGLSAIEIGCPIRILVYRDEELGTIQVMINPVITRRLGSQHVVSKETSSTFDSERIVTNHRSEQVEIKYMSEFRDSMKRIFKGKESRSLQMQIHMFHDPLLVL